MLKLAGVPPAFRPTLLRTANGKLYLADPQQLLVLTLSCEDTIGIVHAATRAKPWA